VGVTADSREVPGRMLVTRDNIIIIIIIIIIIKELRTTTIWALHTDVEKY
jgi:hypothetical protein